MMCEFSFIQILTSSELLFVKYMLLNFLPCKSAIMILKAEESVLESQYEA